MTETFKAILIGLLWLLLVLIGIGSIFSCGTDSDGPVGPPHVIASMTWPGLECNDEPYNSAFTIESIGAKIKWVVIGSGVCHYCGDEYNSLQSFDSLYRQHGLEIVSISICAESYNTKESAMREYACGLKDDYGFAFPVTIDPGAKQTTGLFVGVPHNIFLDKDNILIYEQAGFRVGMAEYIIREELGL